MNPFQPHIAKVMATLFLLLASVNSPVLALSREASHKIELAQAFYQSGNIKMAVREYQIALSIDPTAQEARIPLITLCAKYGAPDLAILECKNYLQAVPTDKNIWLTLANLLGNSNDLSGATKAYQKASDNGAEQASCNYNLGMMLMQHNDFAGAASWLTKATQEKPNFTEAMLALGVVKFKLGDRQSAFANVDQAIKNNSRDPEAYVVKGDLLVADGQPNQALTQYQLALQCAPSKVGPWVLAARTHMKQVLAQRPVSVAAQ